MSFPFRDLKYHIFWLSDKIWWLIYFKFFFCVTQIIFLLNTSFVLMILGLNKLFLMLFCQIHLTLNPLIYWKLNIFKSSTMKEKSFSIFLKKKRISKNTFFISRNKYVSKNKMNEIALINIFAFLSLCLTCILKLLFSESWWSYFVSPDF